MQEQPENSSPTKAFSGSEAVSVVAGDPTIASEAKKDETDQGFDGVIVIYRYEEPYLYGAINKMGSNANNLEWHSPFIISKRKANGDEEVYGTVGRTLSRINAQLDRLTSFQFEAVRRLNEAGIKSMDHNSPISNSTIEKEIIEGQELLFEDVLLTTSVYVRILLDLFPRQEQSLKIPIFNYESENVGTIKLRDISNLMVHTRFLTFRDGYVIDLMSDKKSICDSLPMGAKFNIVDYFDAVQMLLERLTIKDIVNKLRSMVKGLSPSSSIADIVFIVQNLYTLGGMTINVNTPLESGPIQLLLDDVVRRLYNQEQDRVKFETNTHTVLEVKFTTPRF